MARDRIRDQIREYVVDAAGTALPQRYSPSTDIPRQFISSTDTSPESSTTSPGYKTPPSGFETNPNPSPDSRPTAKHREAATRKRPSQNRDNDRRTFNSKRNPKQDGSVSLMQDSSSGRGPSRRRTTNEPTGAHTRDGNTGPTRNEAGNAFASGNYDSYAMPPQTSYNHVPYLVPLARFNPYGEQNYAIPPPMPPHIAPPVPPPMPVHIYPQPAASPHQKSCSDVDSEKMNTLKKLLEEEKSKQKEEQERKKQNVLEQKLREEADEAASQNMSAMKQAEEDERRKLQELERGAYNAAREDMEAEEQRRREQERFAEECRLIVIAKVEAEARREDDERRRAEEEQKLIIKEAEAKVAREMEEARMLQQEEEERMARIREEIEDQVRAQILEEQKAKQLTSSRQNGTLSPHSSRHGCRLSPSTRGPSRPASPSRLEQTKLSDSGAFLQRNSGGKAQTIGVQNLDLGAYMVLNSETGQGFSGDPFLYFEGQSTPPVSLADDESGTQQPCSKCGQYQKNSSPLTLASRIRERSSSYGNVDTRHHGPRRGRPRALLTASESRSKSDNGKASNILVESSDDEWSDISTISTEASSDHDFETPGINSQGIQSCEPVVSSFSVFHYLVTEETSEEEGEDEQEKEGEEDPDEDPDDVEDRDGDDDNADGGATLVGRNGQNATDSLNTFTNYEPEESLVTTRLHKPAETIRGIEESSRDNRLLRLLGHHIKDFELALQRNKSFGNGTPSQECMTGERTRSHDMSYFRSPSYIPNWSGGFVPLFNLPNFVMGGQGKWPWASHGLQISHLTAEPDSASSLLGSDYMPIVPMAFMPCIRLPTSLDRPVVRVSMIADYENEVQPGQRSERCGICGENGHNALDHTTI